MIILLKHSLSLLLKLQRVQMWRLVEGSETWREEIPSQGLVAQLGSSGFLGIIATVPVEDTELVQHHKDLLAWLRALKHFHD